jgi:hypothetical protein
VLIGGIASSTVMARFVTPVVYKLFPTEVKIRHDAAPDAPGPGRREALPV